VLNNLALNFVCLPAGMDSSSYKDHVTSRGFNYHYFFSVPKDSKPFLLLVHGFPSTSHDWHHQVDFFQREGFGLIVPDMLGYGGTSKPTNPEDYVPSLIVQDLVDILNAESVEKSIAIGHDWGSLITSRLANWHPERFTAFGFLALSYMLPSDEGFDLAAIREHTIKTFGYELFGYQVDCSAPGTDKLIEDHWESFHSIVYAADPKSWIEGFCPSGALISRLTENKITPISSHVTSEDIKHSKETLLSGGMAGPLCWYKVVTQGLSAADDAKVPKDARQVSKPVFFGACLYDAICVPELGKAAITQNCKQATIKEYESGHWVILEQAESLNQDLLVWIEGIGKI